MEQELLFVLDETGTTNYPHNAHGSDYAVGGIVLCNDELGRLAAVGRELAKATGNSDYKYKHIQKNTGTRRLLLNALHELNAPSGVYGFYSQGGSLLAEKERSIDAQNEHGLGLDEKTRESVDAIRTGDQQASLDSFYSYFANCVFPYAGAKQCSIRVIMDRRTNLTGLQAACAAEADNYTNHPTFGDLSQRVRFDDVAAGEMSHLVRLAGIVAGDIRMFFNSFGDSLSSMLPDRKLVVTASDFPSLIPEELEKLTLLRKVEGEIGHEESDEGSRHTCMIRGYSDRLLANNLSFAWANGVMGYIYIPSKESWELHQTPDMTVEE